ncbi:hypothetical protein OG21DRAFT_921218 [Imleria badia]|nr:hypothetical protein OG21DRAFT_921218 [Imleria badia]
MHIVIVINDFMVLPREGRQATHKESSQGVKVLPRPPTQEPFSGESGEQASNPGPKLPRKKVDEVTGDITDSDKSRQPRKRIEEADDQNAKEPRKRM